MRLGFCVVISHIGETLVLGGIFFKAQFMHDFITSRLTIIKVGNKLEPDDVKKFAANLSFILGPFLLL